MSLDLLTERSERAGTAEVAGVSLVFVISAPSGSGKTTLVRRLLKEVPGLRFSVSYTTRAPRGTEAEGENYHFVSKAAFKEMILRGEFLEHAEVFDHYYGTHQSVLHAAQEAGEDLVLDIDVQGARQLKMAVEDAVGIFILPPSRQVLEARLRARGEDSDVVIRKRLREAHEEIRNYGRYDYVLVNEDLDRSADLLAAIVKAERLRRGRMEGRVRPILETFEAKEED